MEELIQKLQETINEIYRLDSGWKMRGNWPASHTGAILNPPAKEADIAAAEKKWGFSFPASYREFLLLHDGWEHFFWDFTLLGVGATRTKKAKKEIVELIQEQEKELVGVVDVADKNAVAAWEARDLANLLLSSQLIIGTDFAGKLWLFDSRTRQKDGEMMIVHWSISGGVWDNEDRRFADFTAFLEGMQFQAEAALERLRG